MKKLVNQTWEIGEDEEITIEMDYCQNADVLCIHKGDKMIAFEDTQILDLAEIMKIITNK